MAIQSIPSFGVTPEEQALAAQQAANEEQTVQTAPKSNAALGVTGALAATAGGAAIGKWLVPISKDSFEKSTDTAFNALNQSKQSTEKELENALLKGEEAFKSKEDYKLAKEALDKAKAEKAKFTPFQASPTSAISGVEFEGKTYKLGEDITHNGKTQKASAWMSETQNNAAKAQSVLNATDGGKLDLVRTAFETSVSDSNELTKIFDADGKTVKSYKYKGKEYDLTKLGEQVEGNRTLKQVVDSVDKLEDHRTAFENMRLSALETDAKKAVASLKTKLEAIGQQIEEVKPKTGEGKMPESFKEVFEKLKKGETIADDKKQVQEIVQNITKKMKNKNALIGAGIGLGAAAVILFASAMSSKSAK